MNIHICFEGIQGYLPIGVLQISSLLESIQSYCLLLKLISNSALVCFVIAWSVCTVHTGSLHLMIASDYAARSYDRDERIITATNIYIYDLSSNFPSAAFSPLDQLIYVLLCLTCFFFLLFILLAKWRDCLNKRYLTFFLCSAELLIIS